MQRFFNGEYLAAIDILDAAFDQSGKVTDAFAYQMWCQLRPVIGGGCGSPPPGPTGGCAFRDPDSRRENTHRYSQ